MNAFGGDMATMRPFVSVISDVKSWTDAGKVIEVVSDVGTETADKIKKVTKTDSTPESESGKDKSFEFLGMLDKPKWIIDNELLIYVLTPTANP